MKNFKFSTLLLAPLFAVLAACGGGGGGGSSTPSTPAVATLKSIAVTAPNATIPIGASQTLVATGTFSDGTTKALNAASGVKWEVKSGASTVLQIFTTGIVTGKGVGSESVSATQDGVVGTITIAVTSPWNLVSAGGFQTIARKADGNLYSWGSNIQGQLGDSTTIGRAAPVLVSSGGATTSWKQISVGAQFAVGIRAGTSTTTAGGTLWAWGINQNGQLGDGTTTSRTAPVQIGKDTDWVFVSAGTRHVLAIKANGLLYSWGSNVAGQLGDGTNTPRFAPTKVPGLPATALWASVSAGDTHSLGIMRDGTMWSWGGGTDGQLGNSVNAPTNTPGRIGTTGSTWSSVSAGSIHSMAINNDGTLWVWGRSTYGQVGNGGFDLLSVPTPISPDVKIWSVVSAGVTHSMAVRNDGTLWAWGSNAEGQLGTGNGDELSPVQVGTRSNWSTVSAATGHSAGLQSDNTLWTWGRGLEGQLGDGKSTTSAIPVNIPN
jgi:alpha-tubulin suppressor-like RCC1 family protein